MVRNHDGAVHVVENRCAHRGVAFCQQNFGNRRDFVCPYHQWNYDLTGNLIGVPLRRGVKSEGKVEGGMPADFAPQEHGLTKLKVDVRNGVVFASFDAAVPPLADYLGPTILPYFDRTFDGRELTILGYSRQRIPGNWKLMQENIKDPYHPGLLHTWFVTFGLWRADQKARMLMDEHGRHAAMVSRRNEGGKAAVTQGVTTFRENLALDDARPRCCLRTLVERPDRRHANDFPQRRSAAAGEFAFHAAHHAQRTGLVRLCVDAFRVQG